jgi:hypothetical protein
MRRFALIRIVVISLALFAWAQPAALAQDDELVQVVVQLVAEVRALREEVDRLEDQVATLEEQVAGMGGTAAPAGGELAGVEKIYGTWVRSSSPAYAYCGDSNFPCGSKSDWRNLELRNDGTYVWGETPYEAGTYQVREAGGSAALGIVDLTVVLVGTGDFRCQLTYDAYEGSLWVNVPQCPGLFTPPFTGTTPVELNSGSISFAPIG